MKMKKILASVAAAALAVSAMSVCALASEPVKKPESYEKPPMLISADTTLPDTIYGTGVEVTFNLTVNDVNGGWANGSAGIIADGEILKDAKFGGTECDADSNRSWFPEGSVVIEEGQTSATVVCKADLTGKSGFNIFIFSGQPTDAADNGFFTLDSVTIKNEAGFEATYADGTLTIAGGAEAAPEETTEEATEAPVETAAEEATEAAEATEEATEAPVETTAEAPAETGAVSVEETTEAAPAETTAAPAQVGDTNTATADKGNADTGIEGVAAVAGLAILAAGAVVIAKKRK